MSVQNQIDRISQNVANTYAVLSALGADMPAEQNSDNLAATAGTAKAVLYSEQTLTDEQKAQARENIGALGADDVGDVLEQAKASGEFDGADGKDGNDGLRGTGIYLLKASPSALNPDGYYEITPDMLDSSGVDIIGGDLLYNPSLYELYEVVELEGSMFLSEYIGYLKGDAGKTPVKGTDYYTDADKTEMVGLVKAALPTITLTGTDKNDVVHTWTLYGVEA